MKPSLLVFVIPLVLGTVLYYGNKNGPVSKNSYKEQGAKVVESVTGSEVGNLLQNSFDGWKILSGEWEISRKSAINNGATKEAIMLSPKVLPLENFTYKIEAKWKKGGGGYGVLLADANEKLKGFFYNGHQGVLYLSACANSKALSCRNRIAQPKRYKTNTGWHKVKIDVKGKQIRVYIDGNIVFHAHEEYLSTERVGIRTYLNTQAEFRNPSVHFH